MEGIVVNVSFFKIIYSIKLGISQTEEEPSGNSNSSFHVGDIVFSLLFLYCFLNFLHV